MSSAGIAGWIAHMMFWILLAVGVAFGELGVRTLGVFVGLWVSGFIGFLYSQSFELFMPYVAVLDIALVLMVFKGDVRLRGR